MIILDEPYASVPLLDWMEASAHPVLTNEFTEKLTAGGRALNLVDAAECARRLEAGERIYTNSENALAWFLDHVENPTLTDAIRLFKDKAAMREKLAPLSPGLFHETVDRAGLEAVNVADLPLPVVLKPSVGFCSMGVYVIEEPEDWAAAVADIARREDGWHERYPESVVGSSEYLIEGYLAGTEYALDAYFDEGGTPHILNILRHDFAGPEDTSDRMYLTDGAIVDAWNDRFTAWLAAVNKVVGARSIPVHVELRVDEDTIAPIEFNPLRFAGLGGSKLEPAHLRGLPGRYAGRSGSAVRGASGQGVLHVAAESGSRGRLGAPLRRRGALRAVQPCARLPWVRPGDGGLLRVPVPGNRCGRHGSRRARLAFAQRSHGVRGRRVIMMHLPLSPTTTEVR